MWSWDNVLVLPIIVGLLSILFNQLTSSYFVAAVSIVADAAVTEVSIIVMTVALILYAPLKTINNNGVNVFNTKSTYLWSICIKIHVQEFEKE